MTDADATGPEHHDAGPDDRVARGVEAVQAAATELIAAARAVLDLADELVRDPETAKAVFGAVSSVTRAARGFTPPGAASGDDGPDDDGGVQRIPVS